MATTPLSTTKAQLQNQLRDWATARPDDDPRGRHARLLAADLDTTAGVATWARVDLHHHFRQLPSSSPIGVTILSWFVSVSYLVPIAITWFHLRGAVTAYSKLPAGAEGRPNFLSFWVDLGSASDGYTSLGATALQLLVALAAIALLQAVYSPIVHVLQSRQRKLDRILSECTIHVRRLGAVTPDEVAGALQKSAKAIETAVDSAVVSLRGISEIAGRIVESSDRLMSASGTLQGTTDAMSQAALRLEAVPSKVADLLSGLASLGRTTEDLVLASGAFSEEMRGVTAQLEQSSATGLTLLRSQEGAINALGKLEHVSSGMIDSTERLTRLVAGLNEQIQVISQTVSRNAEDFLLVNSTGHELKSAFDQLERISQQFERAAVEFERHVELSRRIS